MGFCCQEVCKYSWGFPPQAVGRREGKRRQDSEKEVDFASDLHLQIQRRARHPC